MIHVADPQREMRRSLHRAELLSPHVTVELDGGAYLVGYTGGPGPHRHLWRLEISHELVEDLSDALASRLGREADDGPGAAS